jgi:hypothetical protein
MVFIQNPPPLLTQRSHFTKAIYLLTVQARISASCPLRSEP